MINVSKEFRKTMRSRTDFKENATIKLANGTVLELTEKDFTISNNNVVDGAGDSKIPLGAAICRNIQIEIMNDREQYSIYDFFGATINLCLTFQLPDSIEKIPFGEFTVNAPGTYGETIIITAVDDMWKTDSAYHTSLAYPAATGAVLQEICERCDLLLASASFKNSDFVINEPLSSEYTNRAAIGYIAMIAGGNARINRFGRLEIMSYDFTVLDDFKMYDGGTFNPWDQTITVDGGTFNPWNTGDVLDGGTFGDRDNLHILFRWKNIKVGTDDVVITGIRVSCQDEDGKDANVMEGTEGYVLEVVNPLATGNEKDLASRLGIAMIGAKFRKFEGDHIAYPLAEFMDPALIVDRKHNVYRTFITDIDFNFLGMTTMKNCAEDSLRNSSQYANASVKAYINARKLVVKERTEREKAVADLAKQLSESSGLFMTAEVQEDKSTIYYMHDKSTLKESMVVWKLTANALGISTDGGKTYPYGLDVSGTAILASIYAVGINTEYLTAGNIRVGGLKNIPSAIMIYDANGNLIGTWDKNGIDAKKVSAQGTFTTKAETDYGEETAMLTACQLKFYDENNNNKGGMWTGRYNGLMVPAIRTLDTFFMVAGGTAEETYVGYIFNPLGLDVPGGYTERNVFMGASRFVDEIFAREIVFSNEAPRMYGTSYEGNKAVAVDGGFYAYGSIGCSGTKYRVVDTEHYGTVGMNAFETAEAYFSDIGSDKIDENGICRIDFDPVFAETIESDKEYRVQITQTSAKKTEWVEKHEQYFVVHGEPGATFDWMLMCKQRGYSDVRMQRVVLSDAPEEYAGKEDNT